MNVLISEIQILSMGTTCEHVRNYTLNDAELGGRTV